MVFTLGLRHTLDFVQAANLWYNFRDTYIVRFVVDGCRKNLPLCARTEHHERVL